MELWQILVILAIGYLGLQAIRVRSHGKEVSEHQPFNDFAAKSSAILSKVGPATWGGGAEYLHSRDRAVRVMDDLIQEASLIPTPLKQKIYQSSYITLLESFRSEWEGYPYGAEQELIERKANTNKCFRFWDSVKDVTYPPIPTWRQKNWQVFLFGPPK